MKVLVIDSFDSFTYNLVQNFGELGEDVRVYRNDQITVDEIDQYAFCPADEEILRRLKDAYENLS